MLPLLDSDKIRTMSFRLKLLAMVKFLTVVSFSKSGFAEVPIRAVDRKN
jgi:hypothetical protein